MIIRTTHRLIRITGAIGAGFFVLLMLAAWRLSSGPVELHFLTPYVEDALTPDDGSYRINIGATELRWGGWDRPLDLTATDVQGIDSEGVVIATVPSLAIEISGPALLRGMIAPRRIMINRPTVRLNRAAKSGYELDFGRATETGAASSELTRRLVDELLDAPDRSRPLGHLTELAIRDADLQVHDQSLALSLNIPDSDILLQRSPNGLEVQMSTAIDLQGEAAVIDIVGSYQAETALLDLVVGFSNLRLGGVQDIWTAAADFGSSDMSAAGTLTLSVGLDGDFRSIGFDVQTGKGNLTLNDPIDHSFDLDEITLRGRAIEGLDILVVDELSVVSEGASAAVGLRALGLRTGTISFAGNVAGRDIPNNRFNELWPATIGILVRDWVEKNLSDGMVTTANLSLQGSLQGSELTLSDMKGYLDLEHFTVGYLEGMPRVQDVDGRADFTQTTFDIALHTGHIDKLKVDEGRVLFTGLDQEYPNTDIDVRLHGPLDQALHLLDSKPLGYASELGLDPKKASGEASVDLAIDFPAKLALRLSEVEITAKADLTAVALPGLVANLGIREADLALDVNKQRMLIDGTGLLGPVPITLTTTRYFTDQAPFRWQYKVQAEIDAASRHEFGLDFPPFTAPFLEGPVDADIVFTELDGGRGALNAELDLRAAVMSLPGFGWSKGAGVGGKARATLVFVDGRLAAIQSFDFDGAGIEAEGRVAFNEEGTAPNRIEFSKIRFGETDVTASVVAAPDGGFDIAVSGPSFDAATIVGGDEDTGETITAVASAPDQTTQDGNLVPLRISAEIERLWLSPERSVEQVRGFASRSSSRWETADLQGLVGDRKTTRLILTPLENRRRLEIVSDDAGAALEVLGFYKDMQGGRLKIAANIESSKILKVTGGAEIQDFQIVNAPTFARLLSAPSVAGIINMAQGEGINFARMQVPFIINDQIVEIDDARAFGSEIGLSANGTVDLSRDRVDITGTIVPAYALNSLIGQIPLIGEILTGEKGGGVFAANYSLRGPLYDPDPSVNPISALAPGFLRKFFELFSGERSTSPKPGTSKPPQQDNK